MESFIFWLPIAARHRSGAIVQPSLVGDYFLPQYAVNHAWSGVGFFHKFVNPSQITVAWRYLPRRWGRGELGVGQLLSEIAGAPWVGAPKKALAWRAPAAVRPCRLVFSSRRLGMTTVGQTHRSRPRAQSSVKFSLVLQQIFQAGNLLLPGIAGGRACRSQIRIKW